MWNVKSGIRGEGKPGQNSMTREHARRTVPLTQMFNWQMSYSVFGTSGETGWITENVIQPELVYVDRTRRIVPVTQKTATLSFLASVRIADSVSLLYFCIFDIGCALCGNEHREPSPVHVNTENRPLCMLTYAIGVEKKKISNRLYSML